MTAPGTGEKSWAHEDLQPSAAPAGTDPIANRPGQHGFFMIGTEALFLCHMPMFTMERHMYQVVLRASLPGEVMEEYRAGRRADPKLAFNLINSGDDPFSLPQLKSGRRTEFRADLFRDNDGERGEPVGDPFATGIPVTVENVVHFRHFNADLPRPHHMTYLLFGAGGQAHLSHYIAQDPDFQHILTLGSVPSWVSPEQLEAGVLLTIRDMPSTPIPCAPSLPEGECPVLYEGRSDAPAVLDMTGAHDVWFSTANLLNAEDPC
ncbi:hypothetical protein [Thermomonospora cellulosilytica]|uniref:Uncharacterized protein n=1 Tax=Thermomonospora cellulosilytica TaxID=1411118 RepID=A0A7W3R7G4_9ACTN|nr:hypothetical protein [Thermomonospora cellulosilytica]MBA9002657.1 hypothetical protein [Thermomonospora cellulosilytica]